VCDGDRQRVRHTIADELLDTRADLLAPRVVHWRAAPSCATLRRWSPLDGRDPRTA
jgi:hypothetical protein